MFCPACGIEYTQKTNYCKHCGKELSQTWGADAPKRTQLHIAGMFWAVITFSLAAMALLYSLYINFQSKFWWNPAEKFLPIILGLGFTLIVTMLLIWQLARMITAVRRTPQNVIVEKHFIRESPPVQLGAPTDSIARSVDQSSVVEHTTRQFANLYEGPKVEEKTGTR